jgi:hypothetical protein
MSSSETESDTDSSNSLATSSEEEYFGANDDREDHEVFISPIFCSLWTGSSLQICQLSRTSQQICRRSGPKKLVV